VTPLPDPASRPVRVVTRAAVLAVAVAIVAVLPTTAVAEAADRCDGVWVVVDGRAGGGGLTTRCAPGTPSHGLAALRAAGHRYTDVPRIPGMVCTIDGRPDPCNGAPTDAYWSYWHAEAGGSWTYSTRGAGSRTPPPGSVEGWAFGSGQPPGTRPPANPPPPEPSPPPASAEPAPAPSPPPASGTEPAPKPEPSAAPKPSAAPEPSATSSPRAEPPPASAREAEPDPARDRDAAGSGGDEPDRGGSEPEASTDTADPTATPDADGAGDGPDDPGASAAPTPATVPSSPAPARPSDDRDDVPEVDHPGEEAPAPVELRVRTGDDEVAIGVPGGGRGTAGLAAGAALVASIAGAGAFQAHRRRHGSDQ
jgi:hypothetical protein